MKEERRIERCILSEEMEKNKANEKKREKQLLMELQLLVQKLIFHTANATTRELCKEKLEK